MLPGDKGSGPQGLLPQNQSHQSFALLESSLNFAQQEIMTLQRAKHDLQSQLQAQTNETKQLKNEITKISEEKHLADSHVAKLKQEVERREQAENKWRETEKELREQVQEMQKQQLSAMDRGADPVNKMVEDMKKKVAEMSQEKLTVQNELMVMEQRMKQLEHDVSVSNQQKNAETQFFTQEKAKSSKLNFELETVRSEVKTLKEEFDQAKSNLNQNQILLIQAKSGSGKFEQEKENLQKECQMLETKLAHKEGELTLSRQEEQRVKQSNSVIQKQNNQIASQLQEKKLEIDQIQRQLTEKANKYLSVVKKLNQVALAKGQVANGITNIQGESGAQAEDLLGDVQDSNEAMLAQGEDSQSIVTINKRLHEQAVNAVNYIEVLQDKIREYLKEKQILQEQLNTLKKREKSDRLSLQSLQQILNERQHECATYRNEVLLIEQSISDLKDQSLIQKIQQNIFNVQREQKNHRGLMLKEFKKENHIQNLLNEIDELKSEVEKSKIVLDERKEDNQELQSELLKASKMLKSHSQQYSASNVVQSSLVQQQKEREVVVQKESQEQQSILKEKDFQIWLKHLQDSYEQRLQPKLAEIAQLRQELSRSQSELNQLRVQSQFKKAQQPSVTSNQTTEELLRAAQTKLDESEQRSLQLKSELDSTNLSKKFFQDQNQALLKQVQEVQSQLTNQSKTLFELQTQMVQQNASNIEKSQSHSTQLQALQETINHLKSSNDTHQQEKLVSQEELSKALVQLSNSKIMRQQINSQLEQAKVEQAQLKEKIVLSEKEGKEVDAVIMGEGRRKGREMAQLIVQQQKDHQEELRGRDEQIIKFQTLFQEVEVKQAQSQKGFEKKLQDIAKRDQQFILKLKDKLAETEQKNADLDGQVKTLTNKLQALNEEKERLGITDDIQSQEIERLMKERESGNANDGSGPQHSVPKSDGLQMQNLQQRVSGFEHKYKEVEMERDRLNLEIKNIKENAMMVQRALNEEIDSLKERENQLKKTNDLLEKGLEEQKHANLDTVAGSGHRADDGSQEKNLILEERVKKAETETENMRAQRLVALEELKEKKQQLLDFQVKIGNREVESKAMKEQNAELTTQLSQLPVMNEQVKTLQSEKNRLIQRQTQLQSEIAKQNLFHNELQEFNQVKSQLELVRKSFSELEEYVQADKDKPQGQADQKNIFRLLMNSLVRAKRIIVIIEVKIDAFNKKWAAAGNSEKKSGQDGDKGEDDEDAQPLLGKRQRV